MAVTWRLDLFFVTVRKRGRPGFPLSREDLEAFCHDCRDGLKAGTGRRGAVRRNLEKLLAEKSFIEKHAPAGTL